jgi:putative membrane protein
MMKSKREERGTMDSIKKTERIESVFLWSVTILALASAVFSGIFAGDMFGTEGVGILALLGLFFSSYHCIKRYGFNDFIVFFVLVFVIASFYENLSILTTFPFGHYNYVDSLETLGFKIFNVPIGIHFAYFQMLVICWTLSDAMLGRCDNKPSGSNIVLKPVLASMIMVMWDLLFDPFMSTINKRWIWLDGGFYFGVPITNFFGWFLCVFTMSMLFSLYLWKKGKKHPESVIFIKYRRSEWIQFVLFYFSWTLLFLVMSQSTESGRTVVSADGHLWNVRDVLLTCGVVGLFTLLYICIFIAFSVFRRKKVKFRNDNS